MKVVLSTCIFAGVALSVAGAPTLPALMDRQPTISQQQIEEYLRNRRSQYGSQYGNQYVSPCAAASSMAPVAAPAYHVDPHGYMHPPHPYGVPHYRSIDAHLSDPELLTFSEFDQFMPEHIPMARLGGYGTAPPSMPPSIPAMNQIVPATTATVYGVFPNANVGGYNVPLLFSCSPTIVPGHMIESQSPTASIVAPDSYRGVDDQSHLQELHAHREELTSQEHLSTVHEHNKVAPLPQ